MYKLTFKNLRKFHQLNLDGKYERTPSNSEIDELNDMYHLSNRLYLASVNNKICNSKYIKIAEQIDSLPLVSIYFRELLIKDGF